MEYRVAAFFLVGSNFAVMKFHNQTANTQKGSISAERHSRLSSTEKEIKIIGPLLEPKTLPSDQGLYPD